MDVKKIRLNAKIDIDGDIQLIGDYKINGKVLILPITGSGRCNVTLVRPKGEITELVGKSIMKKGKEYVQVTGLNFVVSEVEKVHYQLENLFNGNKELGDNMNLVLNDNWKQIFDDLRGPVQDALGLAFRNIANKVAQKVPYDVIVPLK